MLASLLWKQPLNGPAVGGATEADPIVEAVDAALPELDRIRRQGEAAPAFGRRDFRVLELAAGFFELGVQRFSAFNRIALVAEQGRNLSALRAGGEKGGVFFRAEPAGRAGDSDLAIHFWPIESHGGAGVCLQVAALGTVSMGAKDEASVIDGLEEDHAEAGPAVGIDGCERHCRRVSVTGLFRIRIPALELLDRVTVQVLDIKAAVGELPAVESGGL